MKRNPRLGQNELDAEIKSASRRKTRMLRLMKKTKSHDDKLQGKH